MEELIKAAALVFRCDPRKQTRSRVNFWARCAIVTEMRKDDWFTYQKIADEIGTGDHATMINCKNAHKGLLRDSTYKSHYARFQRLLGYEVLPAKTLVNIPLKNEITPVNTDKKQAFDELFEAIPSEKIDEVLIRFSL